MNEGDLDFLSDIGPEQNDLEQLVKAGHALLEIQRRIKEQELVLDDLKAQENKISSEYIPGVFKKLGLSEFKLEDGTKLSVKTDVFASFPKRDPVARQTAIDWLKERGDEGILKRELFIAEDEEDELAKIKEKLKAERIPFFEDVDVHASTIKAFFSSILGYKKGVPGVVEKDEIPKCFNVFLKEKTTVKLV